MFTQNPLMEATALQGHKDTIAPFKPFKTILYRSGEGQIKCTGNFLEPRSLLLYDAIIVEL